MQKLTKLTRAQHVLNVKD